MADKLVRDLLDQRIPAAELRIETDTAALLALLQRKFGEECGELEQTDFTDAAEFADVLEVLQELARRKGVAWSLIEDTKATKLKERGGFRRGLVWTEAP